MTVDRDAVIARYSGLARRAAAGGRPVDTPGEVPVGGCGADAYTGDGTDLDVPAGAVRASLACGNPVAVADLRAGDTVLDLGSGAGLDVLLSARRVGPTGHVYGLDASPDMLDLARRHATEAGVDNIEFLPGYLEDVPLADGTVDVVISNCVLTLSTDKPRALAEAARVLRPGGRFGISDVVAEDGLDPTRRSAAEQSVGCPVGTLTAGQYRDQLLAAGFTAATVARTHALADGLHSALVHARTPEAPAGVRIRPMRDVDAEQVLSVYQTGLDTGDASFETVAPTWTAFSAAKLPLHRHVAIDAANGQLLGWVAAAPVSDRRVYAGVVEHSVYVHPHHYGRGVGRALLAALADSTETAGIWTIQTGIFPENTASLALHRAAGFSTVGTRDRLGRHDIDGHQRWRDVVLLERRRLDGP